jgi:hypothetical protein
MNGPDAQNIQERVLKKIKEVIKDKGPVQCMVITGDFFKLGSIFALKVQMRRTVLNS